MISGVRKANDIYFAHIDDAGILRLVLEIMNETNEGD